MSTPDAFGPEFSKREGLEHTQLPLRRRVKDRAATFAMVVAVLFAVIPLVVMLATVTARGARVIMSIDWWTAPIPGDVGRADLVGNPLMCELGFGDATSCDVTGKQISVVKGMQPAIVGTIITIIGASALAIPLGVMGAVYLNEYGKQRRLARMIRFMTEVMVGVPSVVMGVFVYSVWVVRLGTAGKSAVAASIALAALMLPIVVRSTEEMLRLVPDSLREASAALGGRTWWTTINVVLPSAAGGIVSGCLLAVARAAGETAPVMFTIGFVTTTNWSLLGQNTTLSAQIYSQLQNGGELATSLAWGSAVTLVLIVLFLTVASRLVTRRFG